MPTDAELLQSYAESRSEEAFVTLVQRYLPVVYGAASRQVGGDPHRAQEIAQSVFTILARKAAGLRGHPALIGWLYTTTYFAAKKLRTTELRRSRLEQSAAVMSEPIDESSEPIDWTRIRPVIDEHLQQLQERDRTAILLRFFFGKSYVEIGEQLGLSENAVRMRVDRAIEKVRSGLDRRGITSTAAALGAALTAEAAVVVPAGVASTVASAALSGAATGGALLFMSSTLYKTTAIVVLVAAGATGLLLQQREIARLRAENEKLIAAFAARKVQSTAKSTAFADSPNRADLARLQEEVARLKGSAASSWEERVATLKEVIKELPEQSIPEVQLATDEDWLDATKGKLETSDDYRRALSKLRNLAVNRFAKLAYPALQKYLKEHADQFPTASADLQSYIERPFDRAIWDRWIIAPSETVSNLGMGEGLIVTQERVVDPDNDYQVVLGRRGWGSTSYYVSDMMTLEKAWRAANPNLPPPTLEQLRPFASTPKQKDALDRAVARKQKKASAAVDD